MKNHAYNEKKFAAHFSPLFLLENGDLRLQEQKIVSKCLEQTFPEASFAGLKVLAILEGL